MKERIRQPLTEVARFIKISLGLRLEVTVCVGFAGVKSFRDKDFIDLYYFLESVIELFKNILSLFKTNAPA